ncbi:hypothetical protein B0H67DRAFT_553452 [Lasiosphaeris hirsuta]|uniref:Uncharacterized protein n=1 Tax=Lasiosphaeris hirsuta TaxID=260670 RepID=A0AA40AFC9_9PEZI|nr:hypothetical protein B0H67DRAFT_553452 [Lasiosphaeris hirsuta]
MAIRQKLLKALAPCILEVERKFRSLAVRQLTQRGGTPAFQTLHALPLQTVGDTYYDKAGLLSSAGAWEAKIRKGGDFANSQFEELHEVGDIAACVERITDGEYPKFLIEMIDFYKHNLHLESVSVVTNGSQVIESFLRKHGKSLDILAVSCDSFDEATNIQIGRGSGDQVKKLYQIAGLNHREDMNAHLSTLKPFRWKCFQVLIVAGGNDTTETLRNGHKFTISDETFGQFCERHKGQPSLVPEPNSLMAKSYLILDEYLRFLDRTGKQPSGPI